MIKVFYDLETTGLSAIENGIHQIAGIIEKDGAVVETFDFKVRPNPKKKITEEALAVAGVTLEQVLAYPPMERVYKQFKMLICKYVDKFDRKDKAFLIGFNNRNFDDNFLRAFFMDNDDPYFGSLFWSASQDVMVLASHYLERRIPKMPNFKLMSVAKELGLLVDETKLHDGSYDVNLTYWIYRIVTGVECEF